MLDWRLAHGGNGLGYASHSAFAQGGLGQTDISTSDYMPGGVFFVDDNGVRTEEGLPDDLYGLLFDDWFFAEECFEEGIDFDIDRLIIRGEDLNFYRQQIIELLKARLVEGIADPQGMCLSAFEGQGTDFVAETCQSLVQGISKGDIRFFIKPTSAKGRTKGVKFSVSYPQLEISTAEPTQIKEAPYIPLILATLIKYEPKVLEGQTLNCSLPTALLAYALAGAELDKVFDPQDGEQVKIGSKGFKHHILLQGSTLTDIKSIYSEMLVDIKNSELSVIEILNKYSTIFRGLGYDVSDVYENVSNITFFGVRPKAVFSNFYDDSRLFSFSGLTEDQIIALSKECGQAMFTTRAVAVYSEVYFLAKGGGFGTRGGHLVRKLKEQGIVG